MTKTIMREQLNPASDPNVRITGIGSSDMPAVVGLSPFCTELEVYLEKRGLVQPDVAGEAAEWGTILEPVILSEYARRNEVYVAGHNRAGAPTLFSPEGEQELWLPGGGEAGELLGTLRHPEHPWMMAHLDGLVIDDAGNVQRQIEAKTAGHWMGAKWGEDGTDEIPEAYIVQIQHAAEVLRATIGRAVPVDVPVLIAGQRWQVHPIHPDPHIAATLIERGTEFWRRVQEGDPPPAAPDERGKNALARLYPESEDEEVIAPPASDLDDWARMLAEARAEKKEAERHCTEIENWIKERMGTAAVLLGEDWKITWKSQSRTTVDWQAVTAELAPDYGIPDERIEQLSEEHAKTSEFRVFRPNLKKIEEANHG